MYSTAPPPRAYREELGQQTTFGPGANYSRQGSYFVLILHFILAAFFHCLFITGAEMAAPWQPGYWETANSSGEHGPPPDQLEHGRIIPTRCSLWMKLVIYFQRLIPHNHGVHEQQNFSNMSVLDGWAYGREAWLSYMVLINETYAHPPDREPTWVRAISVDERHAFFQSLSDCQIRSWELLRDWWEGYYQDAELASNARAFIMAAPDATVDSIQHEASVYQQVLFSLWDAEFNPSGWQTGTSRGLDTNRRMAYEHALAQKAGSLILRDLRPNTITEGQLEYNKELPKCYDICPWLPKEDRNNMREEHLPLYLWDTRENRTVRVHELLKNGIPISYTCISHTWGRWKKDPLSCVQVPGVEWEIPENTLFDVLDLPNILRQTSSESRFIWFDLLCLPQDIMSPEYHSEVARQATIFHHASSCLAWINSVTSWTKLRASLRWLCLYFLHAGSNSNHYEDLLSEASDIQPTIELIPEVNGKGELEHWITSTWTLQESCLFPDIILCNKGWEPLEVATGSPVSLHQLFSIWSVCREGNFIKPIEFWMWPVPVTHLTYIQDMVCGQDVQISRLAILSLGATRECERRRADAVMSAMGITGWYKEYLEEHKEPPPDEDLVLDAYPLAFINEVVSEIGSEFFTNFNPDIMRLEDHDVRGSLLPFGSPGHHLISGSGLGVSQSFYDDTTDEPSLKTWSIKITGSVHIRKASVLRARDFPTADPIQAVLNVAITAGGTECFSSNLQDFLQSSPEGTERLAVALNKIRDTMNGIILQSKTREDGAIVGWINIGAWDTRGMLDFPPTRQLDITVL